MMFLSQLDIYIYVQILFYCQKNWKEMFYILLIFGALFKMLFITS